MVKPHSLCIIKNTHKEESVFGVYLKLVVSGATDKIHITIVTSVLAMTSLGSSSQR